MKQILSSQYVNIPEGVTIEHKSRVVTVTGPRGTLTRNLKHVSCEMCVVGDKMRVDMWMSRKKELAALRSVASHIQNMCTGVTRGYSYSVRFVYNHFPINVAVDGQTISIRNDNDTPMLFAVQPDLPAAYAILPTVGLVPAGEVQLLPQAPLPPWSAGPKS